jgi:hypothetical protein
MIAAEFDLAAGRWRVAFEAAGRAPAFSVVEAAGRAGRFLALPIAAKPGTFINPRAVHADYYSVRRVLAAWR